MDISFYVLLIVGCLVLVLAMWAWAASGTTKWGPDLTLDLPPHILQEALFGPRKPVSTKKLRRAPPIPSAPSELPYAPLLSNEEPMAMCSPPLKTFNPPLKTFSPPPKNFSPSAMANIGATVLVLPPRIEPLHKTKPVFYKFSTEEPA